MWSPYVLVCTEDAHLVASLSVRASMGASMPACQHASNQASGQRLKQTECCSESGKATGVETTDQIGATYLPPRRLA